MPSPPLTRSRLTVGLTISIVLDTAAQLVWKEAALRLPPLAHSAEVVQAVMHQPLFLALGLIFLLRWSAHREIIALAREYNAHKFDNAAPERAPQPKTTL